MKLQLFHHLKHIMKKLIPGCKVWFFKNSYEEILSIKRGVITYKYTTITGEVVCSAPSASSYFGGNTPLKIQYPFKAYLDAI